MKTIASQSKDSPSAKRTPARWIRWLVLSAGLAGVTAIAAVAGVIGAWYYVGPELPPAETIRQIPLQIPLRIYSRDGHLIEEIGERRRILVEYDDVPEHVVNAFVAAEDKRFFEHPGIDYQGILRALYLWGKTGEISGGGSTLTQQLARDYFLSREQLVTRKLREAFLAYKIEQEFSKEEIMALFLNKMFFGQRAYGVAAAAQVYFGKPLAEINVAESATLAGVLPAPSIYNPVRSVRNALVRRGYVLGRMRDLDYIDSQTFDEASNFPMISQIHGTATELLAPYVAEMVRQEMLKRYGDDTYSAGFQVVTSLDSRMQEAANYSLRNGLLEFTRRRGFRGRVASVTVDPEELLKPWEEWPEELRASLISYSAPGSLRVAIVTGIDEERKTANLILQDGEPIELPWFTMSWAKEFIDPFNTGPDPELVGDIMQSGDLVYVMPITLGGYALAQLPLAQSAVVTMDPLDGAITSLAGGYDFSLNKFNRVTQAERQPGSSFKPFIYAAALSEGNSLATIIEDSSVVIDSSDLERLWRPINYSGRFYGEQRLREALVRSMNLASVRLLLYNTGIGNAIRYLRPFGFSDRTLIRNGSLALGGGDASPLDMAQAYASFANGGYAVKPYVIDSIYDAEGEIIYSADPLVVCTECEKLKPRFPLPEANVESSPEVDAEPLEPVEPAEPAFVDYTLQDLFPSVDGEFMSEEQLVALAENYRPNASEAPVLYEDINAAPRIIDPQIAFLIQDAMRSVITSGTGVRALRELQRRDLSGKTGTSNDRRDAWFAGFNSKVVGIVWVGYDDDMPLGPREEGGRTALPIWIELMRIILDGMPHSEMPMPDGIESVRINRTTGCPTTPRDPEWMWEVFRSNNAPECDDAVGPENIFNSFMDEEPLDPELVPDEEEEEDDEEEDEEPLF